jgi:hypothetical protein
MRTTLGVLVAAVLAGACDGTLDTTGEPPPDPARFGPPVGEGFPCDVRQVLVSYCADCHAGQTYSPAFLTPEIVRARNVFTGTTYGDDMITRMQDTTSPMPPSGRQPRPTEADVAIIAAWVGAGMPTGGCGPLMIPNPLR